MAHSGLILCSGQKSTDYIQSMNNDVEELSWKKKQVINYLNWVNEMVNPKYNKNQNTDVNLRDSARKTDVDATSTVLMELLEKVQQKVIKMDETKFVKHCTELVETGGNHNYIIEYYLYANLKWHIHIYHEDKEYIGEMKSISSIELEEFMHTQDEEPYSFGWLLYDYMLKNHINMVDLSDKKQYLRVNQVCNSLNTDMSPRDTYRQFLNELENERNINSEIEFNFQVLKSR